MSETTATAETTETTKATREKRETVYDLDAMTVTVDGWTCEAADLPERRRNFATLFGIATFMLRGNDPVAGFKTLAVGEIRALRTKAVKPLSAPREAIAQALAHALQAERQPGLKGAAKASAVAEHLLETRRIAAGFSAEAAREMMKRSDVHKYYAALRAPAASTEEPSLLEIAGLMPALDEAAD